MFIPWTWIAMAALAVLLGGGGFIGGCSYEHDRGVAALLKATEKARETESGWQAKVTTLEGIHAQEVRSIASKRDAAIASLRSRSERLPEAARAACSGSTGRELSRPDAEDLERLAADADELRSAYKALRAWADTVSK